MILAGDVGGTKVHLALYDFANGQLIHIRDEKYPAREYSGLEEIAKEFLAADKPTSACFGVPGPVRDGRLRLTNLPWTLDSRELQTGLGIPYVFLINDLEANGYGVAELKPDQIYRVNLVGLELSDSVAVGFEIIDEKDIWNAEAGLQLAAVECPGQIGEAQPAVTHGTGHAKAGRCGLVCGEELFCDLFQPGIFPGRI